MYLLFPTELLCCAAPGGGAVAGRQGGAGGGVRCLGDSYYMSADVGQFEPHDVVVMAFNQHVVIQAQKVCVSAPYRPGRRSSSGSSPCPRFCCLATTETRTLASELTANQALP